MRQLRARPPNEPGQIRHHLGVVPLAVTGQTDIMQRPHAVADDDATGASALVTLGTDRLVPIVLGSPWIHRLSMPEAP